MPFSAPHPCGAFGCAILVPRGQSRCPAHTKAREQARGSAAERGYDRRWQIYRLNFLRSTPLCVLCLTIGVVTPATVVDHVQAHKGDERLFWEPSNHRAVCKPHHDARVDEGDFGRSA